jgi:hypothetical protein
MLASVKHTSLLRQRGYKCFETLDTLGIVILQGTGLSAPLGKATNVLTRTRLMGKQGLQYFTG